MLYQYLLFSLNSQVIAQYQFKLDIEKDIKEQFDGCLENKSGILDRYRAYFAVRKSVRAMRKPLKKLSKYKLELFKHYFFSFLPVLLFILLCVKRYFLALIPGKLSGYDLFWLLIFSASIVLSFPYKCRIFTYLLCPLLLTILVSLGGFEISSYYIALLAVQMTANLLIFFLHLAYLSKRKMFGYSVAFLALSLACLLLFFVNSSSFNASLTEPSINYIRTNIVSDISRVATDDIKNSELFLSATMLDRYFDLLTVPPLRNMSSYTFKLNDILLEIEALVTSDTYRIPRDYVEDNDDLRDLIIDGNLKIEIIDAFLLDVQTVLAAEISSDKDLASVRDGLKAATFRFFL